jgi:hypothetical protein
MGYTDLSFLDAPITAYELNEWELVWDGGPDDDEPDTAPVAVPYEFTEAIAA